MSFQWRSFLAGVFVGALFVLGLVSYGRFPGKEDRLSESRAGEGVSLEANEGPRPLRARADVDLFALEEGGASGPERSDPRLGLPQEHSEPPSEVEEGPGTDPPDGRSGSDGNWFDSEALLSLGIREGEIERIEEVWQEYFMNRIRIDNERSRQKDKWKEAAQLDIMNAAQAREALGDESYDAMLYAMGEKNRVFFSKLLEDSPGMSAGLMPGDELISYDGQRIFRPFEIKQLTSEGDRGEWVEVRVQREGEPRRFFVPRGPIGAQLDFRSSPPFELP
ncbi:MAG: PDZ domain-containing protein [Myxococcota bacterium]|nr:PDZ domain-containing protein [Myxococcota bacterium]